MRYAGLGFCVSIQAPLIYLIERHPVYFDRMIFIMRYVSQGLMDGISSTLALSVVQPSKAGNTKLVKDYEDILLNSTGFELISIDPAIARLSADLRARYNLKTPDSLHLATAIYANCDAFLTNDLGLKRVTELRILVLDELELDPPEL